MTASWRRWTPAEDELLADCYGREPAAAIAERLGRSRQAVYERVYLRGMTPAGQLAQHQCDAALIRRLRILLAYRLGVLNEIEAAVAADIPPKRLLVECAREAALGQAEASSES